MINASISAVKIIPLRIADISAAKNCSTKSAIAVKSSDNCSAVNLSGSIA